MRMLFEKRLTPEDVRAFINRTQTEVLFIADPAWSDTDEFYVIIAKLLEKNISFQINPFFPVEWQLKNEDFVTFNEEVIV